MDYSNYREISPPAVQPFLVSTIPEQGNGQDMLDDVVDLGVSTSKHVLSNFYMNIIIC